MTRVLVLRLKARWWDDIAAGRKSVELRLQTDHWRRRLIGRTYDEIHLWRGYPPKTDTEKLLRRRWVSVRSVEVTHEEFGPRPVAVFEIDVSQDVISREMKEQLPFERGAKIRRGELDDELPDYDELTGWLQRVPVTWLRGILARATELCVIREVFQPGKLITFVQRAEQRAAEHPAGVLRDGTIELSEGDKP